MKKILFLFLFLFVSGAVYADTALLLSERVARAAADRVEGAAQLQKAVAQRDTEKLKFLLKNTNRHAWKATDKYGNNLFHLCEDAATFAVLHLYLASVREELLSARNLAGETPWISYIVYGKEDIFLTYFPKSSLYARLVQTTKDLELNGLAGEVAREKRAALVEECSVAHQNMWQRADIMCKGLAQAKGYASYCRTPYNATGMNNAVSPTPCMQAVRDMIAAAAPFLVVHR